MQNYLVADEIMAEWSTEFHLSWSTKSEYRILFTCNCLYTRSKISQSVYNVKYFSMNFFKNQINRKSNEHE